MGKEKKKKRKDKDKEKRKRKEEKARAKAIRKANETPEEKKLRRLEKKMKKNGALQDREEDAICGYTNEKNPFGDHNLTERFTWHKKNRKLEEKGIKVDKRSSRDDERRRREKVEYEIEKVKQRREEREEEHAQWEEEKLRMMREQEAENYAEWERKEEDFNKQTNLIRSQIRIREGREKPIDMLAKNLNLETDFDCEIEEPSTIFDNLSAAELQDLNRDIISYRDFDPHTEFWQQLLIVCDDEILKKKQDKSKRNDGVHTSIKENVENMLGGKNYGELLTLEARIQAKLESEEDINTEYWDAVLKKLHVYKAKERLREIHQETLQKKLAQLLEQNKDDEDESSYEDEDEDEDEDEEEEAAAAPMQATKAPETASSMVETDDANTNEEDMMMAREAAKGGDADEENFTEEISLGENKAYWWQDKYRPRKPRYFNRVHTGYEWNKYNQTHYDTDNPPPKVVQGYKFNIFYPDLIDKTDTPTYHIEKTDEEGVQLVRFHAGPPYEDIAFKIVKREWEQSHRNGFKCSFERGILHLYFRFRRYFYRK